MQLDDNVIKPDYDIDLALFALDTDAHKSWRPVHIKQSVYLAELLHKALISRAADGAADGGGAGGAGGGRRIDCPELTGQDQAGNTLRGGHRHVHILPLDLDGDHYNDHILLYSPMGFGDISISAIENLKRVWDKSGAAGLSLLFSTSTDKLKYHNNSKAISNITNTFIGSGEPSSIWHSATPFVPARYVKARGKKNDLSYQINMELTERGLPAADVSRLPVESFRKILDGFDITRKFGKKPPQNTCYALELKFQSPVSGPICLGYGCHFGLGLFAKAQ